jgi:hypothetical protein
MRLGCACDRGIPANDSIEPFNKAKHCHKCYSFWTVAEFNLARGGDGNVKTVRAAPRAKQKIGNGTVSRPLPCVDLGTKPKPDCGCTDRTCNAGLGTVQHLKECQTCERYVAKGAAIPQSSPRPELRRTPRDAGPTPTVGVVIGSYKWPGLVELQIETIRETCGNQVPICVSSDHPESAAQVQAICDRHADVFHWPNERRIGHTGGDISAFFKAAMWGQSRGLRVVAKLSQRFLVTKPRWLHDGAKDLLDSGLSLATQRCRGTQRFDLRTEACLLDLRTWSEPAILSRIMPRRYWKDSPKGLTAETVIYRVLQDLAGEYFLPWSLFGEDRQTKYPGTVWHCSHGRADYASLAKLHGVELDAGFHTHGWQQDLAAGVYQFG